MFLCSLIDLSDEILDTMITKNSTEREGNITTTMFVLIIIILNKFILGIPLYIHHIIRKICKWISNCGRRRSDWLTLFFYSANSCE